MKIMIPSKNDLIIPKTRFLGAQLLYYSLWNLRRHVRASLLFMEVTLKNVDFLLI